MGGGRGKRKKMEEAQVEKVEWIEKEEARKKYKKEMDDGNNNNNLTKEAGWISLLLLHVQIIRTNIRNRNYFFQKYPIFFIHSEFLKN